MKFSYTSPKHIKIGDIITNTQTSKIWIVLNNQTTKYENVYRCSYMSFDGKVRVDLFQEKVRVLYGNS